MLNDRNEHSICFAVQVRHGLSATGFPFQSEQISAPNNLTIVIQSIVLPSVSVRIEPFSYLKWISFDIPLP